MKGIVICEGRARLFKRSDRPSRYWQVAFHTEGRRRPVVKSSRQDELPAAVEWASRQIAAPAATSKAAAPATVMPGFIAANFPRTIRNAKRAVERQLTLRVLGMIEASPAISQRRLARRLDISIGVANAYVSHCREEGLVAKAMRGSPGRPGGLTLTTRGRATVDELVTWQIGESLGFYRRLLREYAALYREIERIGGRRVVFVGDGDVASIARLALTPIGLTLAGVVALSESEIERAALGRWIGQRACIFVVTAATTPGRIYASLRRIAGEGRAVIPAALLGGAEDTAPEPSGVARRRR
jgi:DNA-binding MarR family transcriptional regulator